MDNWDCWRCNRSNPTARKKCNNCFAARRAVTPLAVAALAPEAASSKSPAANLNRGGPGAHEPRRPIGLAGSDPFLAELMRAGPGPAARKSSAPSVASVKISTSWDAVLAAGRPASSRNAAESGEPCPQQRAPSRAAERHRPLDSAVPAQGHISAAPTHIPSVLQPTQRLPLPPGGLDDPPVLQPLLRSAPAQQWPGTTSAVPPGQGGQPNNAPFAAPQQLAPRQATLPACNDGPPAPLMEELPGYAPGVGGQSVPGKGGQSPHAAVAPRQAYGAPPAHPGFTDGPPAPFMGVSTGAQHATTASRPPSLPGCLNVAAQVYAPQFAGAANAPRAAAAPREPAVANRQTPQKDGPANAPRAMETPPLPGCLDSAAQAHAPQLNGPAHTPFASHTAAPRAMPGQTPQIGGPAHTPFTSHSAAPRAMPAQTPQIGEPPHTPFASHSAAPRAMPAHLAPPLPGCLANAEQAQAASHAPHSALIIFAPAGAGKTLTLVQRVLHLVVSGLPADSVRALLEKTHLKLAFTKQCFTSSLLCTNQPSFRSFRPPALPTLGQCYCTIIGQYTTPPPNSRLYATHHTILVITVWCKGQTPSLQGEGNL